MRTRTEKNLSKRGMEGGREGKRKKEWKERKKGGGRV